MSAQQITPERVLELKREAAALKSEKGIKQTAALAQIAHREGYSSWEVLVARAGGSEVVRDVKREIALENPTEARVRRAERHAERIRRFGGSA